MEVQILEKLDPQSANQLRKGVLWPHNCGSQIWNLEFLRSTNAETELRETSCGTMFAEIPLRKRACGKGGAKT